MNNELNTRDLDAETTCDLLGLVAHCKLLTSNDPDLVDQWMDLHLALRETKREFGEAIGRDLIVLS